MNCRRRRSHGDTEPGIQDQRSNWIASEISRKPHYVLSSKGNGIPPPKRNRMLDVQGPRSFRQGLHPLVRVPEATRAEGAAQCRKEEEAG